MYSGAELSPDRVYRYRLWRIWSDKSKTLAFIMLNPSTAAEARNDPTIERCVRRARLLGFGVVEVVNLFALRSTQPDALYKHPDPIGPDNDRQIVAVARRSALVICAWGVHGMLNGRGAHVRRMLRDHDLHHHIAALRMLRCGEPGHPLYVPYAQQPFQLGA